MHGICLFLGYLCVTHKTLPRIFSYTTGCSLTESVLRPQSHGLRWGKLTFPLCAPESFTILSSPQTEACGLRMAVPRAPDGQWMGALVSGAEKEREWVEEGWMCICICVTHLPLRPPNTCQADSCRESLRRWSGQKAKIPSHSSGASRVAGSEVVW